MDACKSWTDMLPLVEDLLAVAIGGLAESLLACHACGQKRAAEATEAAGRTSSSSRDSNASPSTGISPSCGRDSAGANNASSIPSSGPKGFTPLGGGLGAWVEHTNAGPRLFVMPEDLASKPAEDISAENKVGKLYNITADPACRKYARA
eukprot:scaffold72424_cov32-Prasinocladus_malaysianus.AAC.1